MDWARPFAEGGREGQMTELQSRISLRSLVPDLDPTQYKLHCAVWNGTKHPLDDFARSWQDWVNWNRWRAARNDFNRRFIFSLIQLYSEPNCWLYGGTFEVMARRDTPKSFAYEVDLCQDVLPGCIGRLKVTYRPPGRAVRLRLESSIDEIEVVQILPVRYSGEPFPGHGSIEHSLRQLEVIYATKQPDWRGALEYMKGVYVVYDRTSGKPYVGSAYGDTGIWARWRQYVDSLHGGNFDLRALVDREGDEYVRDNLVFALLEFWPMRTSDEYVLERETYWKRVLMSREFGHNKN
jgi:hypothetical protein